MSNDLLFSILPRATQVPVKERGEVKPVVKANGSESLTDEEKALHDEQRRVTEKFQQEHQREQQKQRQKSARQPGAKLQEEPDNAADSSPTSGKKHIDRYV